MLGCMNCGHIFDEDDAVNQTECTGVSSEGFHEKCETTYCPQCGSDNLTDCARCDICGAWSVHEVCDDCTEALTPVLQMMIKEVRKMGAKDFCEAIWAIQAILEKMEYKHIIRR